LLLAKKSYPAKIGQKSRRSSSLNTQSVLLASLLKPSEAKEVVFREHYNTPDNFREGLETRDEEEAPNNQAISNEEDTGKFSPTRSKFSHHYNTPDSFREGIETRDEADDKVTVNVSPEQFTRQYNTPDKFREGFESRDINVVETRKQNFMPPDDVLHDLNDNNDIPNDSPGRFLGLLRDRQIPEDEIVPEEFRAQERENSGPRISPEIKELATIYYNTDNIFPGIPEVNVISEGNNLNHRTDSEGKAYTEGGLVYLPKQIIGKNLYEFR
jgi:hypothetical protein